MIRFFEHAAPRVVVGPAASAPSGPTLAETMAAYAAATGEDLHPYTNGMQPYGKAAVGANDAKRTKPAPPTPQQQAERRSVRLKWQTQPPTYQDAWVFRVEWARDSSALVALGFGLAAVNEWDAWQP